MDNPNVFINFPILFTTGNIEDGQQIINQEEKRAPINKRHIKLYEKKTSNDIVNEIKRSSRLDNVYKFCDTMQQYNTGAGFILSDILSDAIEKYYDETNTRGNKKIELIEWLVIFLNEIAEIFYDDFRNFRKVNKNKWNVSPYAFIGYIYLSSVLRSKDNWQDKLRQILDNIDFTKTPWVTTTYIDKIMDKYFREILWEGGVLNG